MKILIAEALPLETGAPSIAPLREQALILAILARFNVAASGSPRPRATNSVVTLPGTPSF